MEQQTITNCIMDNPQHEKNKILSRSIIIAVNDWLLHSKKAIAGREHGDDFLLLNQQIEELEKLIFLVIQNNEDDSYGKRS